MKRFIAILALALAAGCNGTGSQSSSGGATSAPQAFLADAEIYAQIEAKLATIDANSALHVALEVKGGNVRMSGKVHDARVLARYVAAAKSVSGVKRVTAQLQADPHLQSAGQLAKDFGLAASVKANVAGQAGVNAFSVDVVANRGVVVLSGTVHTEALKATVLNAARSTNGVHRVVDELRVAP